MHIRAVRERDWQACVELDASYETDVAWQVEMLEEGRMWGARFVEIRLPRTQRMPPPLSSALRAQVWAQADGGWVAVDRRRVVGYIALSVEAERRAARILDLAVMPDHRRQGVATALLAHAVDWGSRRHCEQLLLACPLKAQPAIAFALGQGFSFCGFQEAYWPGQELALLLCRRLH